MLPADPEGEEMGPSRRGTVENHKGVVTAPQLPPRPVSSVRRTSKIEFIEANDDEVESESSDDDDGSGSGSGSGSGEEGSGEESDQGGGDDEGFKVLEAIVSKIKSGAVRPCKHYVDVEFTEPTDVRFLSFKNHYAAFCTIKMKVWMIDTWITLVEEEKLMRNLHIEHDAQDLYILRTVNPLHDTSRVQCLRIYLSQPSPLWLHVQFCVRDLTFYRAETAEEVWMYIQQRAWAEAGGAGNGDGSGAHANGGGPRGCTTIAINGNGAYRVDPKPAPHDLDAVSYNGSEDYNESHGEEESTDEASGDADEDDDEEDELEDDLIIDEDLHRRLCKYLNIATDDLEFEKEKHALEGGGRRDRTTTVRLHRQ